MYRDSWYIVYFSVYHYVIRKLVALAIADKYIHSADREVYSKRCKHDNREATWPIVLLIEYKQYTKKVDACADGVYQARISGRGTRLSKGYIMMYVIYTPRADLHIVV